MVIRRSRGDLVFDILVHVVLAVVLVVVLYPLYFIVISSFSDPNAVNAGEVWLGPVRATAEGYQRILREERLWLGYRNSILYTVLSTVLSLLLILTGAYALSRRDLLGRNFFTMMIVFTMFFHGGLIPTYLLVRSLGMTNTIWALFVPTAVGVYHLVIVRTFFQTTIPDELLEASKMDGCSNLRFFLVVALPLSVPIVAVMTLFNAVKEWNSFFPALIYLRNENLYPLQIILRDILITSQQQQMEMLEDIEEWAEQQRIAGLVKYGVIIVASVPMLILYPFLQKYFVTGVMIGSLKG